MKLHTRSGHLRLGSAYKLFFFGWLISWGAFAGFIILLLLLITLISGEMMVNGEIVSGRWRALAAMLPIVLIFPVVIFLHAVMFSAFLTFGLWVYRLRKPIIVVEQLVDDAIE